MADDDVEMISGTDSDHLDEILQQTSEQTLRLAHIDEGIVELKRSLEDLGEATQAGIVELRSVASARPPAPAAPVVSGDSDLHRQALLERLDDLERRVRSQGTLVGFVCLLVLGQLGALGGLAWLGRETLRVAQTEVVAAVGAAAKIAPSTPPVDAPVQVATDEHKGDDKKAELVAKKKKKR